MDLNECKECGTVGWTLDELKTGKCPHCRALENDDTCENNALLPDVSESVCKHVFTAYDNAINDYRCIWCGLPLKQTVR